MRPHSSLPCCCDARMQSACCTGSHMITNTPALMADAMMPGSTQTYAISVVTVHVYRLVGSSRLQLALIISGNRNNGCAACQTHDGRDTAHVRCEAPTTTSRGVVHAKTNPGTRIRHQHTPTRVETTLHFARSVCRLSQPVGGARVCSLSRTPDAKGALAGRGKLGRSALPRILHQGTAFKPT
jgi:hypothetical protein